jgi:hypothetical protein
MTELHLVLMLHLTSMHTRVLQLSYTDEIIMLECLAMSFLACRIAQEKKTAYGLLYLWCEPFRTQEGIPSLSLGRLGFFFFYSCCQPGGCTQVWRLNATTTSSPATNLPWAPFYDRRNSEDKTVKMVSGHRKSGLSKFFYLRVRVSRKVDRASGNCLNKILNSESYRNAWVATNYMQNWLLK